MEERIRPQTPHYLPSKKTDQRECWEAKSVTSAGPETGTCPLVWPRHSNIYHPSVCMGLSRAQGMPAPAKTFRWHLKTAALVT